MTVNQVNSENEELQSERLCSVFGSRRDIEADTQCILAVLVASKPAAPVTGAVVSHAPIST